MTEQRISVPNIRNRSFKVAYITTEIALHEDIRTYSGGLGVVAGSYLNAAEDLKYPLIAVSFYPSHGYHQQRFNDAGDMVPFYEPNPYPEMVEEIGERFELQINGRKCTVAMYQPRDRNRTHTACILLSTDLEENPNDLRLITRTLYGGSHMTAEHSEGGRWHDENAMKVYQSFVLGIGGFYALKTLGIDVQKYHLNDSHGVMLALHVYGISRVEGKNPNEALSATRHVIRYTNHTLVFAGNLPLNAGFVKNIGSTYAGLDQYFDEVTDKEWVLEPTPVCMKLAGKVNGVSKLHADLLSRQCEKEIIPITNGVYLPMYQDADFAAIDKPEQIPEVKGLKKDVYYRSLVERAAHAGLNVTNASHEAFVNSTVITFARRFARYKRMGLPWHRKELPFVMTLLKWQWISVVWGGKAHPDDKDQLKEWNRRHQQVRDIPNVLPLMNYDLPMIASLAKAGSDIWLNMSLTGHEACGTSGMIGAADCCYDVATHDGMFLEFLKHVIIFGSRHSSDDDILRLSEDDRWHEEYNYDAKDLWQKMHHLISRFRLKDPTLYVELFEAKLQAEEQFSALPVFQKYIAELYSD